MLPKIMTPKGAWKCSVSFERGTTDLNRFQGDDIFKYYMAINSVRPSDPSVSSVVPLKRVQSYVPKFYNKDRKYTTFVIFYESIFYIMYRILIESV